MSVKNNVYSRHAHYRPNYARAPEVLAEPLDVKLMNAVSGLLILAFVGILGLAGLWALIRNPMFALTDISCLLYTSDAADE